MCRDKSHAMNSNNLKEDLQIMSYLPESYPLYVGLLGSTQNLEGNVHLVKTKTFDKEI